MAVELTDRWTSRLTVDLPQFLAELQPGEPIGRYLPCLKGLLPAGRKAALGFSCYGLKTEFMLGLWQRRSEGEQLAWLDFLASYQNPPEQQLDPLRRGAFVDPVVDGYLAHFPLVRRLGRLIRRRATPEAQRKSTVIAETKQALATFVEAGSMAPHPYQGFPQSPQAITDRLNGLDWTRPWGAGAQTAHVCSFVVSAAPRFMSAEAIEALDQTCREFIRELADPQTGTYFRGPQPGQGQLINGAMKILVALDWLEEPIHHPEALLATTLATAPQSTGCHIVDWVYVVYRCICQLGATPDRARDLCGRVLEQVEAHWRAEGGFSYHPNACQRQYYGMPISRGLLTADIHGTVLLTWAVVMALRIVCGPDERFRPTRP